MQVNPVNSNNVTFNSTKNKEAKRIEAPENKEVSKADKTNNWVDRKIYEPVSDFLDDWGGLLTTGLWASMFGAYLYCANQAGKAHNTNRKEPKTEINDNKLQQLNEDVINLTKTIKDTNTVNFMDVVDKYTK